MSEKGVRRHYQLDREVHRASALRRARKPDFYDWWPNFSTNELRMRRTRLPVPAATLLTARNLGTLKALSRNEFVTWAASYNRLEEREKRTTILEILHRVGVSQRVRAAFEGVFRESFFPARYRSLAYLNMSCPISESSNITMFGLQALVLESVASLHPSRLIEVGSGSGLQATLLSWLCGGITALAFERDEGLKEIWERGARHTGRASVDVRWEEYNVDSVSYRDGDCVIFSCGVMPCVVHEIMRRTSRLQQVSVILPRHLTRDEWDSAPFNLLKWKGRRIATFEEYELYPRAYMVLSVFEKTPASDAFYRKDVLNNIQFVEMAIGGIARQNGREGIPPFIREAFHIDE